MFHQLKLRQNWLLCGISLCTLVLLQLVSLDRYGCNSELFSKLIREPSNDFANPVGGLQPHSVVVNNESSSLLQSLPSENRLKNSLASKEERNLVAFTALGTTSTIATVHHNLFSHFKGWDCIVFVHAEETVIPPENKRVQEITDKCSIVRLPGVYWSHFLMTLTPEMIKNYQYIAVVLDDVFAPVRGESPVNMTILLQQMKLYNLSTISPTIKGAFWETTKPREPFCLWSVHHIETFFQIFTKELFICWRSFMHYSNPQAFCLDLCLSQICSSIAKPQPFGVDASMTAYHLGKQYSVQEYVPKSALEGSILMTFDNGTTSSDLSLYREVPAGVEDNLELCHKHNCPKLPYEIPNSECFKKKLK